MNLLTGITPKKFSLLSIGQRGVGKTVFLAGSYSELHSDKQPKHSQQLWFDCQDSEAQENMEKLLGYVAQTGQYPPSTLKSTKFNFSLKRHSLSGIETLCHFEWWEIPGESCNIKNPDFRNMVRNSHGCCVFIDAYALLHNRTYLQALEEIGKQVMVIAELAHLNKLNYPFALILTKCDLLEPCSLNLEQLEKSLQPLTSSLDEMGVNYQIFHTYIPIVYSEGTSSLEAKEAAAPLQWLAWQLSQTYKPGLMKNLLQLVPSLQPIDAQKQQKLTDRSLQSLFNSASKKARVKKILGLYLFPSTRKYVLTAILAGTVVVGLTALALADYNWIFRNEPKNFAVLRSLDSIHSLLEDGQRDQAVRLMEELVQQEPDRVEWRIRLAQLYEVTGQVPKAEAVYDQVLAQQENNLKALVGKAVLRNAQGDAKTAQALFAQAEKIAPSELKAQIHAVAQKTLASP